ncbi:MAG: CDP-glycerol glycerophosphotransferase family protein [Methanobacterium sp.]|nr:CDP-glycerol glycerophosphotransferase family protein [Methanobacterium sp.]
MKQEVKNFIKNHIILPVYGVLRRLPVDNNLIIFESNVGRNYSGNPRYIYEEIVKQGFDKKFKCVWILENTKTEIPGTTIKIKRSRLKYYYYLARAKIWVFDTRDPSHIIKREEGYYIQTWHGTPLKKLGMDLDDVFMAGKGDIKTYKTNIYNDTRKWDFLLSQNEYSTQIFKSAFAFNDESKEIWTYGYPRNDILTNNNNENYINKLKDDLGIPHNKKILLYAPTWRDNEFHRQSMYKFVTAMDFGLLKENLSKDYVIIVKYHYIVMEDIDWSEYDGFVYIYGPEKDIADLYLTADMLITDYSSVMFDYSILKRPIFFFMYDIENYRDELRGFYFDILKELPGPLSKTTEELINDIKGYNYRFYEEKYRAFRDKYNKYDDGKASKRATGRILELKEKDNQFTRIIE